MNPEGKTTPLSKSLQQGAWIEEPIEVLLKALRYRESLEEFLAELEDNE